MDRALIIKKLWLDKILSDGKVWEMRSRRTRITGWIGLIESGSGMIVGKAFLTSGHIKPTKQELLDNFDKHQVADQSMLQKWCYAWTLEQVEKFDTPIPYQHPRGAVVWVKI